MGLLADQVAVLESTLAQVTTDLAAAVETIDSQTAQIAQLEADLAACQDIPPPPGPQPYDGIYVALTDDINQAVSQHPAGTTFILEPGQRSLSSLAVKAGNRYWSSQASFVGPGAKGKPFVVADVPGVILQGIAAEKYGPATTDQSAGMVQYAGGTDWLLEDCDFGFTDRVVVRSGPGWVHRRCHYHHSGKYAMQNTAALVEDCEWSFCGRADIPGVTQWSTQDRGGCKFVDSDGVTVRRLHTHDHGGSGLWWDIRNRNGSAEDILSEDNDRHGVSFEVSYGPFTARRITARRCGSYQRDNEVDVGVPAGILVSLTPDVMIEDSRVEDCRNGLIVRQWNHPQLSNPVTDRSRLGCENIIFAGGTVTGIAQYAAGLSGSEQSGTRPTRNVHWTDIAFDPDARFKSALHI